MNKYDFLKKTYRLHLEGKRDYLQCLEEIIDYKKSSPLQKGLKFEILINCFSDEKSKVEKISKILEIKEKKLKINQKNLPKFSRKIFN